ncbi:MAG: EpsG family protein [Flavobacteriaceae bacterium]|nr:EpsG family protein [Flavobacteriaceae bacterium]
MLWFFTSFFGLTFVLTEDSGDAIRYAEDLYNMHSNLGYDGFKGLLLVSGGYTDLYQPLLTFLVSVFTDDPKYLFALFGLVLGYFFSKNIFIVLYAIKSNKNKFAFLLVILLAFVIHIGSGINGVRMWTGAHIFIYGTLSYFLHNNRKGLIVCLLSIFVHFSLLLPVLILFGLVATNFKFSLKLAYIIFLASFVFAEANFSLGRDLVQNLPGVYDERASSYVSEAVENQILTKGYRERHWSKNISDYSLKALSLIFASILFFYRRKLIQSNGIKHLFLFGVLFFSLTNYFSLIPSIGRYLKIALFLILVVYIISYINNKEIRKPIYNLAILPFLVGYLIFQLRVFLDYPSLWLIIGNPLVAILVDNEITLYKFIF